MSALSIQPTYPILTDIDGQPLENGFVWIGTANLDPQANPITAYWDAALTQVATQPVRTRGGYPLNGTSVGRLYVNSDYSISVQNRNGATVYSAPAATERYGNIIISAADVSYLPAGTGAVATTVQTKLRETVSVKDFGAVGDGVADDTAAFNAALAASSSVDIPDGNYNGTELTMPADKILSGRGFVSSYLNRIVLGAKSVLQKIKLSSASVIPLKITAGADDVVLNEVTVSGANYATTFDLTGTEGLTISNSTFTSDGYALLTNNQGLTTPSASKRISITNTYAKSVDADAVELNHPSADVTGVIAAGNFLETTGTGTAITAGFAYGNANTKQWVFANNIILDSRLEAIHIEDSQRGGTVTGNSVRSRSHGLLTYPNIAGAGQGSFPVVANSFYAPAKVTPPGGVVNSGIFVSYSAPYNPPNGMPIVGNVVEGFTRGVFLRPALATTTYANIQLVDNNHLKNNTYSLRFEGANVAKNRQFGTNFSTGTTDLIQVTSTWSVGKIYSDSTPTNIISTTSGYNNFMPSCVDGFGYPLAGGATSPGVPTHTILFPAGANNRFFGRVRFEGRRSGVADWIYQSADILWDGSTLTVTNQIGRSNVVGAGAWTSPNFNVGGGNCRFSVTTTNAIGLEFRWVEFDGEYYDA